MLLDNVCFSENEPSGFHLPKLHLLHDTSNYFIPFPPSFWKDMTVKIRKGKEMNKVDWFCCYNAAFFLILGLLHVMFCMRKLIKVCGRKWMISLSCYAFILRWNVDFLCLYAWESQSISNIENYISCKCYYAFITF